MLKRLIIPILFLTCIYSQNKTLVKKTEIVEDTRTVIATGVGVDRDKAVEDGLRNAVEQAIGVYLKSTTIVENYQAIDKLLTHSRGYVKEYNIISERAEPPLYRVKLSAVVIVRELKASLLELNLYTKEIEGKSLFATAMTKVNATQQGLRLLEDLFDGYPRNAFIVEYGNPDVKTDNTEALAVYIPYTVKWNMDFIYDLKEILDEIAVDFTPWVDDQIYKPQITNPKKENDYYYFAGNRYLINRSISKYLGKSFHSEGYYVFNSHGYYHWPTIRTELIDNNGETLKQSSLGFRKDLFKYRFSLTKEIPNLKKQKSSYNIKFQIPLDEMNQIVKFAGYATKK